ncbi:ABC transporter permease [Lactococcus allomyrinae]|uniref:ABC transporter permease n=1 Tax=Lactococcus allomyrinae TaxID=2419773 RepID=A0A387BGQ8_9LACT|nr:ABC transporter permease [Lactococcus allomyrinae]AYG00040.1 ABC transporter permease [Lactococcus allomyrinae]
MFKGLMKYHFTVLSRDYLNVLFGLALPFVMLFALSQQIPEAELSAFLESHFVVWLFISGMVLTFFGVAWGHIHTRKTRFLRRLRMTPVTAKDFLLTGFTACLPILATMAIALLAVMNLQMGKDLSGRNWLSFGLTLLIGFVMCYLMSMFMANVVPNAKMSESLMYIGFFGLIGLLQFQQIFPENVRQILDYLPNFSALEMMMTAWTGGNIFVGGALYITLAWIIVFGLLTVKFFKYE